jgi:beta-aspartyl-dipeptidase (metallo-type)
MLILIRNAQVFAPESLGIRDVLIAGEHIAQVAPKIDLTATAVVELDAGGRWLLPGFVDPLTHPTGGGGEGGFGNRTSGIDAADFVRAGVTTPVGALGTDSIMRSLDELFGQVMKLRSRGLSAQMFSGSYRVPAITLTGDVARDLVLVEPVIGVGEVAISDHRSSQPSAEELRRLAADIHLGGTLSGKGGTLFLHVGDGPSGLELVERALAGSDLPRRLFYPTHCNRHPALLTQAAEHAAAGGFADFTASTTPELIAAGEVPAPEALRQAVEAGAPAARLTFSSDAGGSLPRYENGRLVGLDVAGPGSLLQLLRAACATEGEPPVDILAALTLNPARALGLRRKGRVEPGADADLLLLDPDGVQLHDVFSRGRHMLRDGRIEDSTEQAQPHSRS